MAKVMIHQLRSQRASSSDPGLYGRFFMPQSHAKDDLCSSSPSLHAHSQYSPELLRPRSYSHLLGKLLPLPVRSLGLGVFRDKLDALKFGSLTIEVFGLGLLPKLKRRLVSRCTARCSRGLGE